MKKLFIEMHYHLYEMMCEESYDRKVSIRQVLSEIVFNLYKEKIMKRGETYPDCDTEDDFRTLLVKPKSIKNMKSVGR